MSNFCPTMIYMATGEIKQIQQVEHFEDFEDTIFEDFDEECKVCEQNLKEQKYKLMKYIDGEIMMMSNLCLMNETTIE